MAQTPTPLEFRSITPHFSVKGAIKAIEFYRQAFGAEEVSRMPMPGEADKLMHATIRIGDSLVMLGDCNPEGSQDGSRVVLHLYVADADGVMAQAEAAGAEVIMPLADMFWGDRYGQVRDPFGIIWAIATHQRDLSTEEIEKGAIEEMAAMNSPQS